MGSRNWFVIHKSIHETIFVIYFIFLKMNFQSCSRTKIAKYLKHFKEKFQLYDMIEILLLPANKIGYSYKKQAICDVCAIWYHLYKLKNVKNTHEGVLLFVKYLYLYKWY